MRDAPPAPGPSANPHAVFERDTKRISYPPDLRPNSKHSDLSPAFLSWLTEEGLSGKHVLDLGCGDGKLTFALSPHAERIGGLDRDEQAIRRAGEKAAKEKSANIFFAVADVETVEYDEPQWGGRPDVVTAHLCMSDPMIERAGRALGEGSVFAGVALHPNQWSETGIPSRFAYSAETIVGRLTQAGFRVDRGRVEEEVLVFDSSAEAERVLLNRARQPDGWTLNEQRANGLRDYLRNGGRELTRKCHLSFMARKVS